MINYYYNVKFQRLIKSEILKSKLTMFSINEGPPPASPKFQNTELGGDTAHSRQVKALNH